MEPITEYPKALYPSPDQRSTPVTVSNAAEEAAAREAGHMTLPEWWVESGVPDAEPEEFFAAKPAEAAKPARASKKAAS